MKNWTAADDKNYAKSALSLFHLNADWTALTYPYFG
jgi:hypothetical protein